MTSHSLKVDNCSHCTTPSERNGPPLVSVKVGCFHINPASIRGRRIFLLQMVILCFVPHAALLIQNCSIMAQLSQTFDSSLFLNSEVNTTLSLGEMVLAVQEERFYVTKHLFTDSETSLLNSTTLQGIFSITDRWLNDAPHSLVPHTYKLTLYHLREDLVSIMNLKKGDSFTRVSIYQQINAILLVYMMKNVKSTKSPLWRQLSVCYEIVHAIDELSVSLTLATYAISSEEGEMIQDVKYHLAIVLEYLRSVTQYLEIEKIESNTLQYIYTFYTRSSLFSSNITAKEEWNASASKYMNDTYSLLAQLREEQVALWATFRLKEKNPLDYRESASLEIWSARRTLVVGISVLGIVICAAPVLILLLRHTFQTLQIFTESIEHSTQQLMAEKQKSDLLLSRMLPMPVLRRLRAQRTVPAEAFDAVTIYFSDIVGFTNIAATSTPLEIINMLNMLYRMFDDQIMKYNVYKVETIGDAYMVVSGLPQRNGNRHASEIADMSLALMRSVEGAWVPHRPRAALRLRAGINTGPCVAGVVGATMPRYCLFGDTINTASRMESTGEPMKIHISPTTKAALDEIGSYIMESRGVVDVQGKGPMETFWLVGKVGEIVKESPPCLRLEDYDQNVLELLIK